MIFEKGHQLGARRISPVELDKDPLSIKLIAGHRERLRAIPGWQEKIRALVEQMIAEADGERSSEMSKDVRETGS